MKHTLDEMIEIARRVTVSPEEEESQRRSFAYGNVAFENPLVTREMVDRAAERAWKNDG